MNDNEPKADKCRVVCSYCRAEYDVVIPDDTSPLLCDRCLTPNLRVLYREVVASIEVDLLDSTLG